MRSLLLAAVLTVCPALAVGQPQHRFEARLVQGSPATPVAGASVSIVGVTGTVETDADGRFVWAPAPAVPFQLIVVLPGGTVARPVIVESLSETLTSIVIDAMNDESVTVLGAAPSISTAPASATTVLSRAQIAQRTPENLMQALETVAGVNQVSEGHAAVPALRGLARGRTLILIDGGRVTSERRVGPSATFLDPAVVEGIDVARGPGSVAYGSDALGGVISVRTRHAEPGSPLAVRGTVTGGAGIPEAFGSVQVSKGLERGGVLVQAHARNAEDYDSPEGEVFNSGWEDSGFLVNVAHAAGPGVISASWQSDFGRDFERPRNNSRTVRFSYPYENSHRLTSSYELPGVAGFRKVAITGFLGTYEQRTDQDRFATATSGRSIERADVSANDFHVKGSADRVMGRTRLEFGLDVNGRYGLEAYDTYQNWNTAGDQTRDETFASVADARRVDLGAFAQAETALTRILRISGGIRADRVTTDNAGGYVGDRSTANGAASGFAAVTVDPAAGLSLTAQVSRGFRDPMLSDRYYRGPTGRGFITGNPDLDPETSLQVDLAARYAFGATQFGAYFYDYRISDLVERYQTEPDFFYFRNRGRARLRGVEVEARSDLGRGYSVEVATQFARGTALDDDASLDDISPDMFSVRGRKAFDGDRLYVQGRLALFAEDDRPGPSEIVTPGATVLDLGAGWRLARQLEVRGLIRNLLDEEYPASPDARYVLAPGRSATLTAVVAF